ncbi:uncharacterized protein SPPG_05177 [Spizellomyces punctatus DAOM BR117]|uniref:Uncharacterized protein n=1 Tax=Spizellomyces punctatus (strain DAOM BR117) TaxID=645134 RepID=A0A0L0HEB1_SPIPD|nr:uncharacterized protein SPPG_05177 [Spizellomyces punctatus DAOM BR117]KNC99800.1 hypothetical protein SPPG_05177 [Spizellomyces punctatus DAOM BR117]|eukprot:XP_016607840.1 hypothetical protein SPPG_05177 [Spizellomyces punctatus DAOM BR117]
MNLVATVFFLVLTTTTKSTYAHLTDLFLLPTPNNPCPTITHLNTTICKTTELAPNTETRLGWASNTTGGLVSLFFEATPTTFIASNLSSTETTLFIPSTPIRIGALYTRNGTTDPPLFITLTAPSSSNTVSHIALIVGLSSILALTVLLASFFWWRRHIRNQPGYASRKVQRKRGMSVIPVFDRFWPKDEDTSPVLPPRPCFRPSHDVVPPTLCRTFTWQKDSVVVLEREPSSGEVPDGWDEESGFGDTKRIVH